jgi:hypothetical protein
MKIHHNQSLDAECRMHDIVMGLFVNRYACGLLV